MTTINDGKAIKMHMATVTEPKCITADQHKRCTFFIWNLDSKVTLVSKELKVQEANVIEASSSFPEFNWLLLFRKHSYLLAVCAAKHVVSYPLET